MLVLLIIFMVAAPMLQRGVEVNLPVARRRTRSPASALSSTCRSLRNDRRVSLGKEPVAIESWPSGSGSDGQRSDKQVFLRSDGQLSVQNIIDVIDRLKAAGIPNVGIVTELPTR